MKISRTKSGQVGLLLTLAVLSSACNKEEFFKAEEFVVGADAVCMQAATLESCQSLADICQPAYMDLADENLEPQFSACVANPDTWDDGSTGGTDGGSNGDTDGGADGGSTGGTDGGVDGGSTGGTDGGVDGGSTGGTDGGVDGGTTGGTDGGTTGGSNGDTTGGTDGGSSDDDDDSVPTIEDAWKAKCEGLDEKYLLVKKIVKKDNVKYEKKVKICHQTGNNSAHTIIIACPALKPHVKHHDDYLGACNQ